MIGKTVSHYRVVGQLGSGGMGVVYEATDERLGRSVALKFVPDNLAKDDSTLRRLRAEARTASLLSHPHICTVYDIDESDGRPFIVMELLRGVSLRERLTARPIRIPEIVDLAIQTADGLDYAHSKGVMHRDIKPANLFMNERGLVKIVDFGLAKLVGLQGSPVLTVGGGDLTATGVTPGTVSYMSPEQIKDDELDGRSDIFSFGVVLYECVTGQRPFAGPTPFMTLAAVLNDAPAPPSTLNAELPPRLQDVIHNCLEKDRELRYQSAGDLRADLRRVKRDLETSSSARVTGFERSSANVTTLSGSQDVLAGRSAAQPVGESQPATRSSASRIAVPVGAAVVALVGIAGGAWYFAGRRADSVPPPATIAANPALDDDEAARLRDQARSLAARFEAAIARARAAVATRDFDAAASAIEAARAIDPASPAVTELSSRLIAALRTRENVPRSTVTPSEGAAAAGPSPSRTPRGEAASRGPEPPRHEASIPAAQAPVVTAPSPAPVAEPPVTRPAPALAAVAPAPVSRAPEPAPAAASNTALPPAPALPQASAPAEDDDAAIRRAIATYVRAIESKDVALFRSIKPNTSTEEQRRIEEGFRAVTSQRVAVRVLGIERRGTEAVVRLRRTDTIDAGGRERTTETEQGMTLTRSGTGWIIRDIGR